MKRGQYIFINLITMLLCANLFAQGETMNWYFGNKAGLDFTGGLVSALGDGEMNTINGCSTISDWRGNLMFYTNGETVWNKNHVIMDNGTDLAGQKENSQSSIIIPKPEDPNVYYIFTTRIEDKIGTFIGRWVYYSTIEFSSTNPLGIVTEKNKLLVRSASSEKITAVHHEDGKSIWLITLTSESLGDVNPKNTFNVFNIDNNGVNETPIQSVSDYNIPTLGMMNISQNGKRIAMTGNTPDDDATRFIFVFDFDNTTGEVTDDIRILPDTMPFTPLVANGVAFSPNSETLYYTYKHVTTQASGAVSGIVQLYFDPLGLSTKTILHEDSRTFHGGMQLANDGMIYVVLSSDDDEENNALGAIQNPNERGFLSNYDPNVLRLTPGKSRQGLPNFTQSYFASKVLTENQCVFDTFSFSAESYADIDSINWDFGDGNTSSSLTPDHIYTTAGNYSVKAEMVVAGANVLVYKYVTVFALPNLISGQDLVQCDTDNDGLSTFNLFNIREKITDPSLEEEMFFYESSADALADTNQITNPDLYNNSVPDQEIFVRVINSNGCVEFTSFFLRADFIPVAPIADMFTCEFQDNESTTPIGNFDLRVKRNLIRTELGLPNSTSLTFFETLQDAQTITNELPIDYDSSTKTIWVRIVGIGSLNCGGLKSFNIIVNPKPVINLQDSYSICDDPTVNPITLTADTSNDNVQWLDDAGQIISTQRSIFLNQIGTYTLIAFKTENGLECTNAKTFSVIKYPPPTIVSIEVSENTSLFDVLVTVEGDSSYEFSMNGIDYFGSGTSHTLTNVLPGVRTVYVRDLNNCEPTAQEEIPIIGYPPFFTPNDDNINDFWNIKGVSDSYYKSIYIRIYNRYGKAIYEITDFQSTGWNGTYNGKKMMPNDYWFSAQIIDLNDNIIKKNGNFSLIRNE
ncbi:MAG: T9SS type B sorting domain-containing protein [Flavobacteriaceae bacterium]